MKIKQIFPLVCLLSSSLLCVQGGYAIDKNLIKDNKSEVSDESYTTEAQQKEVLKKYKEGETFKQGNSEYTIYPELTLSFNKKESAQDAKKVVKTASFSIFEAKSEPLSDDKSLQTKKKSAVVYNKTTGKFGAFNGKMIVQLKEGKTFSDTSFKISKSFPHLGYIVIEMLDNMTINESISKLKSNSSVANVTVEVVEHLQEPL
ncbi:hypothetical protein [Fluviispira multicolorata]|uniref:Lipoprotein n=1 Tax=Fluviispira multicolorata TaxID=2654512 RepID=A0A833JD40_9BACT|nr:hypothetical protein [Fluviispira multicolorata]KAB8031053.1 hypothetical protein GCL57_08790 [Fluviispira multicolorata]